MKGSHISRNHPTGGRTGNHDSHGVGVRPGSRGTIKGGQKDMMGLGREKFMGSTASGSVSIKGGLHT